VRLRLGKAVEWEIHRRDGLGGYEVWECGTERDMRKRFKDKFNNGHEDMESNEDDFVLVKLTYEKVSVPMKGNANG
jgi:hypothetical protein